MDHYDLNFWLWACLHDAEAYLESSRQLNSITTSYNERLSTKRHLDLNQYHFAMTMGSLVKNLNRLAPLFPSIQPVLNAAEHLKKEGLYLRNMIEHKEKNLEAANKGLFCQLITVPLFKDHKILTQVSGHGSHTIKLLPPLTITGEDCNWIETAFDSVIASSHKVPGAIWSLGKTLVDNAIRKSA